MEIYLNEFSQLINEHPFVKTLIFITKNPAKVV